MSLRRRTAPMSTAFGSKLLGPANQSPQALRRRVQLLLSGLLVSTNLAGAALVLVITLFVVPSPKPNRESAVALFVAVPAYVVAAVVLGAVVGTATTLRALRWVSAGREPDEADRRRTLRVPLRLTQLQLAMWLAATGLFTVLALSLQPRRALVTGLTVGIAGVVGSGVAYLLTEFAMRPLSARALAGEPLTRRPRFVGVGDRMVIFWCLGTGAPVVGLVVVSGLALAGYDTTRTRLAVLGLVVGAVVLSFGLFITILNARSVVAPVLSVRDALLDVERGNLDREVVVYDGTELGLLQAGFNTMVEGLRDRERLRDLFGRHVGQAVAAAASLGQVELGGETRTVSVLFVDVAGSTAYAAAHRPEKVVRVLNGFFGVIVDEVDRRGGLVNKFIGDAVLAVFGAPVDRPDHATAALVAARAIAGRLVREVPEIRAGVGVATGEVVAGNVGHHSRFEYTVVGDAVNAASRITELAKRAEPALLATWDAVAAASAEEAACWARGGAVTLRGRSEQTVLAVPRDPPPR